MASHLVADWRRVLRRAWSMRFVYAAVAVMVLAEVVPTTVDSFYLPARLDQILRIVGIALTFAAIPARIYLQKEFHDE